MTHLSSARSCKWYNKGKNVDRTDIDPVIDSEPVRGRAQRIEDERDDFHDVMGNHDLFRFDLPPPPIDQSETMAASSSQASSSSVNPVPLLRHRHNGPNLDDNEDTRIEEEDTLAGAVIRMSSTVVETWKAYFGESDIESDDRMDVDEEDTNMDTELPLKDPNIKWRPFASELDWRVAMWAVREDVGQKSLNRLLSIPGVSAV